MSEPVETNSMNPEPVLGAGPLDPRARRFTIAVTITMLIALPILVGALAALQRPLPSGSFELGTLRTFEGVLLERPIPVLRLAYGDGVAAFLVVGFGKHGLPAVAKGSHGQLVRFEGTLIYKGRMTMVELTDPGSFEVIGPGPSARRQTRIAAPVTLTGELIDTKCYLGVMRPATGKVHRACAARCLSGGVPPGLLVRDQGDDNGDDDLVVMLAGPEGEPLDYDVQWAARLVEARGVLELHDELAVLRVSSLALRD